MRLHLYNRVLESDGKLGSWMPEPWLLTGTLSYFSSGHKTSQAQLFLRTGEESSLHCQQAWFPNPGQTLALQLPEPYRGGPGSLYSEASGW